MNYQTFEPDQDLAAFIKCYWTLESPKEEIPEKQTIVPDGCMAMIFHYGDLYKQYLDNGNSIIQPRCFVIGQLTRPLEIEPTGEIGNFLRSLSSGRFFAFYHYSHKGDGKYCCFIGKAVWKAWTGNRATDLKCQLHCGEDKAY